MLCVDFYTVWILVMQYRDFYHWIFIQCGHFYSLWRSLSRVEAFIQLRDSYL